MPNLDDKFNVIYSYLRQYPDQLSGRRRLDLHSNEGKNTLRELFKAGREQRVTVERAGTIPDEMVSHILKIIHSYTDDELENIKMTHQQSMVAENCVGALLERYIASIIENYGWVWCSGDIVRSIDFIRQGTNDTWTELQIKNRDNSENSSSSRVRAGTDIKKWHRTISRTGATHWEAFPDAQMCSLLSEEGFRSYVTEYFKDTA